MKLLLELCKSFSDCYPGRKKQCRIAEASRRTWRKRDTSARAAEDTSLCLYLRYSARS